MFQQRGLYDVNLFVGNLLTWVRNFNETFLLRSISLANTQLMQRN